MVKKICVIIGFIVIVTFFIFLIETPFSSTVNDNTHDPYKIVIDSSTSEADFSSNGNQSDLFNDDIFAFPPKKTAIQRLIESDGPIVNKFSGNLRPFQSFKYFDPPSNDPRFVDTIQTIGDRHIRLEGVNLTIKKESILTDNEGYLITVDELHENMEVKVWVDLVFHSSPALADIVFLQVQ